MAFQCFEETQKFQAKWLYIFPFIHIPMTLFIYQDIGFDYSKFAFWIPIISFLFEIAIITWLLSWQMSLSMDKSSGVKLLLKNTFYKNRNWEWDEIALINFAENNKIGLGIGSKFWGKNRYREYIFSTSSYVVKIKLKNGKEFRISTEKKADWEEFLNTLKFEPYVY